jgi:predicted nucleotidyltransferase
MSDSAQVEARTSILRTKRQPRDLPAVPPKLETLISRIRTTYRPLEVWLFGSRARGEARPRSDWDLLVVLSDDAADELLDPMLGWTLQRDSGVYADILCARRSEFLADLGIANTAAREVERDGVLLYAA